MVAARLAQPPLDLPGDFGSRNAVAVMQRGKRSRGKKFVGQSDLTEGRMDAGAHQQARNRLSEAADDGVVLGDDDETTGLAGFAQNRFVHRAA